jgi:menaquinone-dependent protoporphyrinogen oxidase
MSRIYIPYATREGQTAEIAARIAEVARARGDEPEVVDIRKSRGARVPDACDGVILGSSIHIGKHDKKAGEFVRQNRDALGRTASAFFSVSLAAHGDGSEAERYVDEFRQQTGWRPDQVAMFPGALRYTRYGFLKRRMMRKIASEKPGGLSTDTSKDHVYTDWDAVERFAEDFLARLHQETGAR